MKKMQKGGMIKSIMKPFNKKVVKKITKPTTPKMAVGGTTTKRIIKKSTGGMYGIPQENLGTSGQYGFAKKGGSTGTHKMPNGKIMLNSKMQKGGIIKAMKKVVKKITRPTLRKAQNGIEMNGYGEDTNMMIDKPGSTGGYKAPVRPGIEYMSGKPGLSGRTPGRTRPNARPAMTRSEMINLGKDKNTPYYGMSEEDMINKGIIFKPPYKKGGATKAAKFAALAPPYDKATFADKIVGAKKSAGSKKLPKAQLGGLLKGVSKISKFFGPAAGATGKSSKIIKPAAKAVKKIKNPRMNSNSDYLKWQAKQIGAGAILAIPPSLALTGAANYYKNKDNKNRNAVNKNKVKVNTNKIKVKTKKN